MDTRDILISLDIWYEHDWNKVYSVIKRKDFSIFENESAVNLLVDTKLYALFKEGYKILVLGDEEYPKKILSFSRPPFVIYYKGDLDTVKDRYSYSSPEINATRMFVD